MKFNLNFLFIFLISCQIIMAATLRSLKQGGTKPNGAVCDSNLECQFNKCSAVPPRYYVQICV